MTLSLNAPHYVSDTRFISPGIFSWRSLYRGMIAGISFLGRLYLSYPNEQASRFHIHPITGRVVYSRDFEGK